MAQVAGATRALHAEGFIHTDLKWRNILATLGNNPEISLIDCPAGMKALPLLFSRGIIKDLACLDKTARYHLTRTQRMRFYRLYAQNNRLTSLDKQRIRKILTFFEGRE